MNVADAERGREVTSAEDQISVEAGETTAAGGYALRRGECCARGLPSAGFGGRRWLPVGGCGFGGVGEREALGDQDCWTVGGDDPIRTS
jgi:hypothetical protein